MKLTSVEQFEIKAGAFRRMTGMMAPGKDASPHSYQPEYEIREAVYRLWSEMYGKCVSAVLASTEHVIEREEPEA